ncbi:MAG: N-acetyl-gamma-glutamyl-phosphate reductase [Patescibacteria group bacterium]
MSLTCAIIGGSGYTGGELLRLLLAHPKFVVAQITSESNAGKRVTELHPNLRSFTDLKFISIENLEKTDIILAALPHETSRDLYGKLRPLANQVYVDLSNDFRLDDSFVYAMPEVYREKLKTASQMAGCGCNATATILALYPFYKENLIDQTRTVVEAKISSSAAGNKPTSGSHHPERSGVVRSYKPTGHRHIKEMRRVLNTDNVHFSATSIEMVRGILATAHVFTKEKLTDKDIWKLYRSYYGEEPFIRMVKERAGDYRYPEPKLLRGTNFCDIGFEVDDASNRIVIMSAIDNLVKGSAGHVVQALNIRFGFDERLGLEFAGLHPC